MNIKELAEALIENNGGIDNCTKKKLQQSIKELETEVFEKLNKAKDPNNVSNIQKYLNRIFELSPQCNFIPLAYELQYESSIETSKDFDELVDLCENYLIDNDDIYYPAPDDEMKIKEWNEINDCWKKAVLKSNIQEGTDHDGDYCSLDHYSIYGYFRETKKIGYLADVNG